MRWLLLKELLRKGYAVQKDPEQRLNYNHIKRKKLERNKYLSFSFAYKGSESISATCLPTVSEIKSPCNSIDTSASSASSHCSFEDDSDDDKTNERNCFRVHKKKKLQVAWCWTIHPGYLITGSPELGE